MSSNDKPIPAAAHHKPLEFIVPTYEPDNKPRRCSRCEGWRHPVGNCVLCGSGPAPGAVNFFGEPMPKTDLEKQIVIWKLFHNIFPSTLNSRDYPTPNQLYAFVVEDER